MRLSQRATRLARYWSFVFSLRPAQCGKTYLQDSGTGQKGGEPFSKQSSNRETKDLVDFTFGFAAFKRRVHTVVYTLIDNLPPPSPPKKRKVLSAIISISLSPFSLT
jgi:hypothetical protein